MCLFREYRRRKRIAREIFERHDMLDEYKAARLNGQDPIEALEEWDLLDEEARERLFEGRDKR